MDGQLRDGLPPHWSYSREQASLQWKIVPRERATNSLGDGYTLEVSWDFSLFILYYGNAPSGCAGIDRSLWTAVVIGSERLSDCSLAQAIACLIAHPDQFPENRWTLT